MKKLSMLPHRLAGVLFPINPRSRRRFASLHQDRVDLRTGSGVARTGPLGEALAACKAQEGGLTNAEARARLRNLGPNEVAHERPPHPLTQLVSAFNNPFIWVLVVLAVISYVSDPTDLKPVVIVGVMVGLSVALRFWQEFRSARAAAALKALVSTTASAIRRDHYTSPPRQREIPVRDLVIGDIIHLSAGDMIPADVRLVQSRDLFVSQAILTGESLPVEKYDTLGAVAEKSAVTAAPAAQGDGGSPLEASHLCYMGTNVVSGQATALVVATGADTYLDSVARAVVGRRPPTAFDRGVNSVTWILIRFMVVMVPIVFVINGVAKGDWLEALLFAISVAVGLTPEMLPLVVTANLAKGAVALSKRKVVVKRLNAIQNLGAIDVLCTDKTGTLTQDRVILEYHLSPEGKRDDRVFDLAWRNSIYQSGMKNLLDVAVVEHGADHGYGNDMLVGRPKVDEVPFDFVRRRLSVVVDEGAGEHLMICKGAVEEMLSICTDVRDDFDVHPLDDQRRTEMRERAHQLNEDGLRVILVATRRFGFGATQALYDASDEHDLVLEGMLAFLDPPKESAGPAIAALRSQGVDVKILTGDNAIVARKICRDVGLDVGTPLLGDEVEAMDDTALALAARRTIVFAKVSPLQKARIVRVLQSAGHTVGFLGDGINDAPALRDADVGISVDTGADIAKESADIILLEKSLTIISDGVTMGRETFGNIIKYIKMTASSNFGNVFSVLVASAFLPFLPMLPIQLLIQNLCYDISQLSIPWDRMDPEYLTKPRKWYAGDIARFMAVIGPISSIFDMVTFYVMWTVFGANTVGEQALFQSGWFIEGLLSQTLIVHMIRTRRIPFIQSRATLPVLLLTSAIMAIGIAIPFTSLGAAVGLVPLPFSYFPILVATLLGYCILTQGIKTLYIRAFRAWL
ncbi:MAG: magnesium-translocating P-type ATPase [Pseudomonadota bacterium]